MKFEDKIKKIIGKDSFCVVGNSPNEIGNKHGKRIDSYKSIIRFNDYSISFPRDYGKRIDVWARATNDTVIETLKEKNDWPHRMIFIRSLNEKNEKSISYLEKNNRQFIIFPVEYENKLSKELGSIPSLGLLFLYILKQNDYNITKKNVYGFSFFDRGDLLSHKNYHYFNTKTNVISCGIALSKHNWKSERLYYKENIG